jgi:predicted secreted hydrolase
MAAKITKRFGGLHRFSTRFVVTICAALSISSMLLFSFAAEKKFPKEQTVTTNPSLNPSINHEGWQEATAGYLYSFPRDHASHPSHKIEWWYYIGNLESKSGRRFGYQLTFFRVGVVPVPLIDSRWAVRDLFMAHFAISDIERKQFHFFERLNRAGVGWAGASTDSYRVWNEDWEAKLEGSDHLLQASEENFQIDLRLASEKREVIHGFNGISQKGPLGVNASHYYSMTRLKTSGKVKIEGEEFDVTGISWMDHEFGTSFLIPEQKGWDWFSIQLDDGRDLMLFQTRNEDGSIDERSSGTIINRDGSVSHIPFGDMKLTPLKNWSSEASGATYPTEWRIEIPRYGLQLYVEAAFPAQELRATESIGIIYWEGSIDVRDAKGGRGRGYLEMTGYSGQNMGEILR